MFKNLVMFRITTDWNADLAIAEEALGKAKFVPCGPTQMQSVGWVEPRGEDNGPLIEAIDGNWLVQLCTEKKVLPGSVVKRAIEEKVKQIEEQRGQRPGKKEIRDIKEEVVLTLLPKAFTKLDTIRVWLNPADKLVVVDAGSIARADSVITALITELQGLGMKLVATNTSAMTAMSLWLTDSKAPEPFDLDREVELKSSGEDKALVKYARHNLNIAEIVKHIEDGKVPTKLAMVYGGRVTFTLTDTLVIKKLAFTDVVLEDHHADADDSFDTDFTLFTGEMKEFIPAVIAALDGEVATA